MDRNTERRFMQGLEIREGKGGPVLTGYAAVFNEKSLDLGGFREVVQPGAFAESLKRGDDVVALVQHDSGAILGRRSRGTLVIEEDSKGLRYDVTLPDTQVGRDIAVNVGRGDINGSSFAFRTVKDRWARDKAAGDSIVRFLEQVDLFDVGPVTYPAYPSTNDQVAMRHLLDVGKKVLALVDIPDLAGRDRVIASFNERAKLSLWTPAGHMA